MDKNWSTNKSVPGMLFLRGSQGGSKKKKKVAFRDRYPVRVPGTSSKRKATNQASFVLLLLRNKGRAAMAITYTFSQIRTVRIYVPVSYGIPVVYSSSGHSSPTDGSISSIDPKSKVWSMSTPCSVPMISRSADHYIYDDTTIGGTASIDYDSTIRRHDRR